MYSNIPNFLKSVLEWLKIALFNANKCFINDVFTNMFNKGGLKNKVKRK